jgi:Mn-containing catalase
MVGGRSIHRLIPDHGAYSKHIRVQKDEESIEKALPIYGRRRRSWGAIRASTTCRQSEEIFEISNGLLLHKKVGARFRRSAATFLSPRRFVMFIHNKRLQYTVRVAQPNPGLANLLLEQFGGAQGELAAASRYFTQALAEDDPGRKDLLMDIATEELSHLEIVGSIIVMLNKGAKGHMAEGVEEEGELYRAINGAGNDSHITSLLYGAGAPLTNSAGVPWSAAYVDTIGEPTADMRSNIAAEARAKIVYERLMNVTDDPGVKEALGFLMTREIAHQLSFEKALHAIQPNFPQGKLPGMPEFTNVYFNMSQGEGSTRGPWNQGDDWEFVEEPTPAVDGGDGMASVKLSAEDDALLMDMKARTMSDPDSNPVTGADLGAGVQIEPEA